MPNYKISNPTRSERYGNGDVKVIEYRVHIVTDRGASGDVTIPESVWTGDGLRERLDQEADNLDKAFIVLED